MIQHSSTQKKKGIHPQKFGMWIAIGSIIMMFGGFTSGFIVRKAQGSWLEFELPLLFYISTLIILLSSLTIWVAVRSFKRRQMRLHKRMVSITMVLGLLFAVSQYIGFKELFATTQWNNNVSFQYLLVIIGVHALHVLGGVVALAIMFFRTFSKRIKIYSAAGLEIISTYWHFVDILWIYLFIFFLLNQ